MIEDHGEFAEDQWAGQLLALKATVLSGKIGLLRAVPSGWISDDTTSGLGNAMLPVALPPDKDASVVATTITSEGAVTAATGWHHDQSFADVVPDWSILHCDENSVPTVPTVFADMAALLASRSDGLIQFLRTQRALHAAYYPDAGIFLPQALAVAQHPCVVEVEGDTEALMIAPATFATLVGWTRADSLAVLQHLFDMMNWPEWVIAHAWAVGDLLLWPNRRYAHRALPKMTAGRRTLVRLSGYWDAT